MPQFAKLTPAEVADLHRRRVEPVGDVRAYLTFLSNLEVGEWGRLLVDEGESPRTVKRRVRRVAELLRKQIRYRKAPEGQVLVGVKGSRR